MKEKSKFHMWFRIYFIISIILLPVDFIICLIMDKPEYFKYSLFFFIPLIYVIFSLNYYPFDYSAIGKVKRRAFPKEKPSKVFYNTVFQIGFSSPLPFLALYFFEKGIGLDIIGFGRTYILYDEIEAVEMNKIGNVKIIHKYEGMRSPINIYNDSVYNVLNEKLT